MGESKPGHFQICDEMAKRGMDIRLSLLENITNLRLTHKGKDTDVTIGVSGNVIAQIAEGKFVGGLLLCDKDQYFAIAKELTAKGDGR